jgi:ring-1,2-phenylacetyl-CoA epoxidase subunit PaaD
VSASAPVVSVVEQQPGTVRDPTAQTGAVDQKDARVSAAWRALAPLKDPELPALTLVDLGIVRFVQVQSDGMLEVGLSPTYTGCPATDYIRQLAAEALAKACVGAFSITHVLAPPWSSDWITPEGRRKLAEYGIVPPPNPARELKPDAPIACPRCRSLNTERLSQFGSTPCKALHRCLDCLEPFECFKCI